MRHRMGSVLDGYGPQDLMKRLLSEWEPWLLSQDPAFYGGMLLGGQRLCNVNPALLDSTHPLRQQGPHGRYIISVETLTRMGRSWIIAGFARSNLGSYIDIGLDPKSSPEELERCRTALCGFELVDVPTLQHPTWYLVVIEGIRD